MGESSHIFGYVKESGFSMQYKTVQDESAERSFCTVLYALKPLFCSKA